MIISFNKLNQYEIPVLTLCNLSSCATANNQGGVSITDTIGCLFDISDVEVIWNFNSMSELNFVVHCSENSGDQSRDAESLRMYNATRSRRAIYLEGYGYFIIDNVSPKSSNGVKTKDVHAYSCEYEFNNVALPYIPEDAGLGLYGNTRHSSEAFVLDNILAVMPTWSVGEVSSTLLNRMRFFENTNYDNCYDFIMSELQSAFECIFDFDILNRTINIYDQNIYVQETDIQITSKDFIKEISVQEDTDSFFTSLYVTGQDDIDILAVNPLGTNLIYNLDYYKNDMLPGTLSAWESWESKVEGHRNVYSYNEENYQIKYLESIAKQSDIQILNTEYDIYSSCYDAVLSESLTTAKISKFDKSLQDISAAIIGEGGLDIKAETLRDEAAAILRNKMNEVQSAILSVQNQYDQIIGDSVESILENLSSVYTGYYYNNLFYATRTWKDGRYVYSDLIPGSAGKIVIRVDKVSGEIFRRVYGYNGSSWVLQTLTTNLCLAIRETITSSLSFQRNFTEQQLIELSSYIHQGKYEDPYAVITTAMTYSDRMTQFNEMYDRGKEILKKAAQPSYQYTIDTDNFVFLPSMKHFTDALQTGRLVWVELGKNDFAQLFLNSITINYSDAALSLTFGNRYNKNDIRSLYNDVLGSVQKTASTVDMLKDLTYPIRKNKLTQLEEMILKIRTLAKDEALRSDTEEVVLDSGGYLGRALNERGEFSPEQIKLVHNRLLFTDDAFQTIKTVIGKIPLSDGTSMYGINAEALIGDLIMGGKLTISNSNGDFIIDDSGIKMEFVSDNNGRKRILLDDGAITLYADSYDSNDSDKIKIGDGFIRFYGDPTADNNHQWEPNESAYLAKDSFNFYNGRIFNQLNFQRDDIAEGGGSASEYSWIWFPRSNGNFSIKWAGTSNKN